MGSWACCSPSACLNIEVDGGALEREMEEYPTSYVLSLSDQIPYLVLIAMVYKEVVPEGGCNQMLAVQQLFELYRNGDHGRTRAVWNLLIKIHYSPSVMRQVFPKQHCDEQLRLQVIYAWAWATGGGDLTDPARAVPHRLHTPTC